MKNSGALRASLALAGAALICGISAKSYAHSGTQQEQEACKPDVFRFCSAQIPDENRIVACLNRHLVKLSPACRAVMAGDTASKKSREAR